MRVSISESGRFDGPESGALWGLDPRTDVLVRPPATSMHLQDFFALTDSNTNSTSGTSGAVTETFYLEYLALSQYLGKVSTVDHQNPNRLFLSLLCSLSPLFSSRLLFLLYTSISHSSF